MKNYVEGIVDLTGDSYINPTGTLYGDGSGTHQRSLSSINVIGVHHDAAQRPHLYDSVARIKQETREHYNRLGPGAQYHWSVDNLGQIFLLRPLTTWLYAVGSEANTRGIWIKLDGYFHPDINQKPTLEQYEALAQLIDYLMTQRPDMPNLVYPNVAPHSSFSPTACCGDTLRPYVLQVVDSNTAFNIPQDAVYDWPSLQPTPTIPIVPVPAPVPDLPAFEHPWVQDNSFKPASYIAQVKTHLDGLTSGMRYADYEPGWKADFVARFTKEGEQARLLTAYSIEAAAKNKRELAGVPEKDMLLAQVPGSIPASPSPANPTQPPPLVEVSPTPSLPEQDHDYENRLSAIEKLVKSIADFLDKLFKSWRN